jgi:NADH:ubiquinone oxidoreductase subunit K
MSGTSSLIIALLAAAEGAIGLAVLVTDLRARVARRRAVVGPSSATCPSS